MLVHALGWSQVDTAEILGVDVSTVRTHIARGTAKLSTAPIVLSVRTSSAGNPGNWRITLRERSTSTASTEP